MKLAELNAAPGPAESARAMSGLQCSKLSTCNPAGDPLKQLRSGAGKILSVLMVPCRQLSTSCASPFIGSSHICINARIEFGWIQFISHFQGISAWELDTVATTIIALFARGDCVMRTRFSNNFFSHYTRIQRRVRPCLHALGVSEDEEERRRVAVDLCALGEQLGVVDVGDLEARPHDVHTGVTAAAAARLSEVARLVAQVRCL